MCSARRFRHSLWAVLACLLAAGLVATLAACGGDSPATAQTPAQTTTEVETRGRVKSPAELARERPRPADPGNECNAVVGEFLGSMDSLRKNLVIGLSYEEYVTEMKRIRAAYEAIPTERVALGCLRAAGTPAERGLNQYIAANNAWTKCVETPGCKSASIEAELQERWRSAARYLSKAQAGLAQLQRS